jgi:hypothetical protein
VKRFFLDTEFLEAGPEHPVRFVSIGLVAEDGRTYYAESSETDLSLANDWVKQHVLPHLKRGGYAKPRAQIKTELLAFIGTEPAEFWGYFSAYDWVVFAQLFGTMVELPKGLPMHCNDLKQWMSGLGITKKGLPKQQGIEHNALEDALWNKAVFEFLSQRATPNLTVRIPQK